GGSGRARALCPRPPPWPHPEDPAPGTPPSATPPKEPDMVDVPAQLQSVTRTYRVEERDGEPAHVQTLEQTYPAPLADVWAAVTGTWGMMASVSWVTLRLAADGEESTRVELEHTSRTADVPAEMWETFGPGATGVGWDGGLLGLALHLGATEGSLSPAEAEAWAATDEGRSFYRGAADGWAVAHTASGEDPAVAQQRADATYGFYTGTGQEG